MCCKECKTSEMINVVDKRCPCGKQPMFNMPEETIGICCAKCKTDDMIDVKHQRCSCGKRPSFNVPEKTIGMYCADCRTSNMVNVMDKKCLCGKIPVFNVPEQTKGVCCVDCRTSDMINVVDKKCPCGIRPCFNWPGGKVGICCMKCKSEGMVDVVNKLCPGYTTECPVRTHISNGHKYCMSCDPNDDRRKLYKRYEEAFFDYVKDKLNVHQREFRVSFDPYETAKKYARVDGIVFGDGVIVCLEVDENGHVDYECEEHRMHLVTAELLQKYPDHTVSWVRVNPTIGAKNEWGGPSKKKREKRFDEVISKVNEIIDTKITTLVYIGF